MNCRFPQLQLSPSSQDGHVHAVGPDGDVVWSFDSGAPLVSSYQDYTSSPFRTNPDAQEEQDDGDLRSVNFRSQPAYVQEFRSGGGPGLGFSQVSDDGQLDA